MPTTDPRIDAYIAKSALFARPILTHLRALVHKACPGVEETMKWSMPHFMYKGMLCGMAAFKAHCTFGFWKGDLVVGGALPTTRERGMGQFGRIASAADLPSDRVMLGFIRKAMALNEAAVPSPMRSKAAIASRKRDLVVPDDLTAALSKNKKARAAFEAFSYSHRKDYVEWITEAKRAETRERRVATTVQWLAEGKSRNWKYEAC